MQFLKNKWIGGWLLTYVTFFSCNGKFLTDSYPEDSTIVYEEKSVDKEEDLPFKTLLNNDVYSISEEQIALEGEEGTDQGYEREIAKGPLVFDAGNLTGKFQIKFKPETFYAKNANLLNNANKSDRIMFSRSTVDVNFGLYYGKECYGFDIVDFFITLRNKSIWGDPETVARSTVSRVKILGSVEGPHVHFITRQIFWMRELWLKFAVGATFGVPFENHHYFMLGAFPFELGRGISLGSAYAVNPGVLGFYSDISIDQYAWGFKFGGEVIPSLFTYDLYAAILQNKSDSFYVTAENIYGQKYGHFLDQARGSGHINFVFAGRARMIPVKNDNMVINVEPYFLFNNDPEQLVEFPADARSKLGTFGLAAEFTHSDFEWGFDAAINVGGQSVFGWDRNEVQSQNVIGNFTLVNSQVTVGSPTGPNVVYAPTNANGRTVQALIEAEPQTSAENGQFIDMAPDPTDPSNTSPTIALYNSYNRFRDPYDNNFKGWMVVADAAQWFCDRTIRIALGFGVASGDEDPNVDFLNPNDSNVDGTFKGFIGLQELYTGDRVQSAFLLGGAGRIPRPLSTPTGLQVIDKIPTNVSGFTNLAFIGGSCMWSPKTYARNFSLRPNVLVYWQQHATKKFDVLTKQSSATEFARNYLGTEANVFFDTDLVKDFKFFFIISVFFPGAHFSDIKGTPLSKEQQRILDRADVTGGDTVPLLGDDIAYTANIGLEYRF